MANEPGATPGMTSVSSRALLATSAILVVIAAGWSLAGLTSRQPVATTSLYLCGLVLSFIGFVSLLLAVEERSTTISRIVLEEGPRIERPAEDSDVPQATIPISDVEAPADASEIATGDQQDLVTTPSTAAATPRVTTDTDRRFLEKVKVHVRSAYLALPGLAAANDLAGSVYHYLHHAGAFF